MTAEKLKRRIRFYPPYLGAGVRVTHVADDFRTVKVEMPLRFYNKNYVGTHFGGSLYAMCDPFFMLMLINILGPGYIVWDKAAAIRFKKPGKGLVKATFTISEEKIAELNIPTAVPLVYQLNDDLSPIKSFYLGDQEAIARKAQAVADQTRKD